MKKQYLASLLMATTFLLLTTNSLLAQEPVSTTEDGREVYLESMVEDMSAEKRDKIMGQPEKFVIVPSLSDLEPAKANQLSDTKTKSNQKPNKSNGIEDERTKVRELHDKGEITKNEYENRMNKLKDTDNPASPSEKLNQDEMAGDDDRPIAPQEKMPKDDEIEGPKDDEMDVSDDGSPSEYKAATPEENDGSMSDKMKEKGVAPSDSDAEGMEGSEMEVAPSDKGDIMPKDSAGENTDDGSDSENGNGHQNKNAGQENGATDQFEQKFQQLLEKGYSEEEIEDKLKSKYPSKF